MAAGSQFSSMNVIEQRAQCKPYAARQALGSVRNVAQRMCFPVHPAKRTCRLHRNTHHRTTAVVAAPEKVDSGHVPPFQAWTTGAAIKKREDIKSILLLGAGPIVIGQVWRYLSSAPLDACCASRLTRCDPGRPSSSTTLERKHVKLSSKHDNVSQDCMRGLCVTLTLTPTVVLEGLKGTALFC